MQKEPDSKMHTMDSCNNQSITGLVSSQSEGQLSTASLQTTEVVKDTRKNASTGDLAKETPKKRGSGTVKKTRKWKKPKDMPKRPLSAYNLFFASERQKLLENGGLSKDKQDDKTKGASPKIGFAGLARSVAAKWKTLDDKDKARFLETAEKEQARYKKEIEQWKLTQDHRRDSTTSLTEDLSTTDDVAVFGALNHSASSNLIGEISSDMNYEPLDEMSENNTEIFNSFAMVSRIFGTTGSRDNSNNQNNNIITASFAMDGISPLRHNMSTDSISQDGAHQQGSNNMFQSVNAEQSPFYATISSILPATAALSQQFLSDNSSMFDVASAMMAAQKHRNSFHQNTGLSILQMQNLAPASSAVQSKLEDPTSVQQVNEHDKSDKTNDFVEKSRVAKELSSPADPYMQRLLSQLDDEDCDFLSSLRMCK